MAAVDEARRMAGDGTPEAVWTAWPELARLPRQALGDWLPRSSRLVVVAPHPDDEVLACGALLSAHAARGSACLVVAVTDGEASHAGSPAWTPATLAVARRAESLAGLVALGVRREEVVRLGLPDGQVAEHATQLQAGLALVLRSSDVVLSTWRGDGHPDHEATGHAAAAVCARIGCQLIEAPVWMWHWATPGDARVPWSRLRGFSAPPKALEAKQQALAAHRSQTAPRGDGEDGEGPVLGPAILDRARRDTEFFFI